ncbi:PREDICTED: kelch domain-containing protein 3-like, partial [Amphimedon queenslandica]
MDRNLDVSLGQYQLGWRAQHTTAVVGEVLYCWGGRVREGLDKSHDSPTKKQYTSAIDAFNLLSGVWSSQPTSGTPPLGIRGVSCTTINNNIYYFGGYCGHDSCYHNSLNCLNTLILHWKELQPTSDNSVTKRAFGGMIVMGSEGGEPQQLLVIGGLAPKSATTPYHQFEYIEIPGVDGHVRTNEQNIYNLSS